MIVGRAMEFADTVGPPVTWCRVRDRRCARGARPGRPRRHGASDALLALPGLSRRSSISRRHRACKGSRRGRPQIAREARDLMRTVPADPETLRLDQALAEFRRQRPGMAIVIDDSWAPLALVTFEDVLEQLVGEVTRRVRSSEGAAIAKEGPGNFVRSMGSSRSHDLRDRLASRARGRAVRHGRWHGVRPAGTRREGRRHAWRSGLSLHGHGGRRPARRAK